MKEAITALKHDMDESKESAGQGAVVEYVALELEKAFFQSLDAVLNSTDWQWVPREAWTLRTQSLCFRLSSKLGCLVHKSRSPPTPIRSNSSIF